MDSEIKNSIPFIITTHKNKLFRGKANATCTETYNKNYIMQMKEIRLMI